MQLSPLELQIQTLPDNPGVYQYYDKDGKILYVGKAKNLKKRVSSYFTKVHENGKTRVLVKKIATIKHIVVPTRSEEHTSELQSRPHLVCRLLLEKKKEKKDQ